MISCFQLCCFGVDTHGRTVLDAWIGPAQDREYLGPSPSNVSVTALGTPEHLENSGNLSYFEGLRIPRYEGEGKFNLGV